MKTQYSLKNHFTHIFVLTSLAGWIAFPGPARSQIWTQTGAPAEYWACTAASSADGSKLAAGVMGGAIYTSTNSGTTWTASTPPSLYDWWYGLACSADGTTLVAFGTSDWADTTGSTIYVSTNAGVTWTAANALSNPYIWWGIACSGDGTKMVAASGPSSGTGDGFIYTSTNSGFTWTQTSAPDSPLWSAVGSSADGSTLVAGLYNQGIYRSTNSGATWSPATTPTANWYAFASSADGSKWVAAASSDPGSPSATAGIYTSTNAGASWKKTSLPVESWACVASSADGTILAAMAWFGVPIYLSTDSGTTWWTSTTGPGCWGALAMSADGTQLIVPTGPTGLSGGAFTFGSRSTFGIWTLGIYPHPLPSLSITPGAGNAMISWTIPVRNSALQQNSSLATTNWSNVATSPVLNLTNFQNQVTVPAPSSGNLFYRLKHSK